MTPTQTPADVKAITDALAAPFELREVKFKPQTVKGNRALALAYIDCRLIQDRLDEVLGVENWTDDYQILADGSVMCKLQLNIGGNWIAKMDVGSPSEQPDGGDRLKAAVSDALKRAAVKFGIGRYLYRLQADWVDYDPVKRKFTQQPQLPAFALPKPAPKAVPAATAKDIEPMPVAARAVKPAAKTISVPVPASEHPPERKGDPKPVVTRMPENGEELHRRLRDYDAKLSAEKVFIPGSLLAHVTQAGADLGYGDDMTAWAGPAIAFAVAKAKEFADSKRNEHQQVAA